MKGACTVASVAVILLLTLGLSANADGVWIENDSLHVSVPFTVNYWEECWGPVDGGTDFIYPVAWNPDPTTACTKPEGYTTIEGKSYCHFKILNEDGSCILFNSQVYGPREAGLYWLEMSLPLEEELEESSFSFGDNSDFYMIIMLYYYHADSFMVKYGEHYTVQITAQWEGCRDGDYPDGEKVRVEEPIFPCCQGRRGDVNMSGQLNSADLIYLIDWMYRGGPAPPCMEEADVDGSGRIDNLDLLYLVDYIWKGGPPPVDCP